jgi:hypothetical protein
MTFLAMGRRAVELIQIAAGLWINRRIGAWKCSISFFFNNLALLRMKRQTFKFHRHCIKLVIIMDENFKLESLT